jgi:exosortase/archaeosortase
MVVLACCVHECGAVDSNQDAMGVLGGYFSRINREARRNLAMLVLAIAFLFVANLLKVILARAGSNLEQAVALLRT